MRKLLYDAVPMLALYILLYRAIGHSVSLPRAIAVGCVVGLFRIHAVWMAVCW